MKRRSACIARALAGLCLLASLPARAEDASSERSTAEAFLLSGDEQRNPGEPGAAKVATVVTLYALSAASFAASAVFAARALSAASDAEEYRSAQPRGFCDDPSAESCVRYDTLRSSQNASTRGVGLFAGLGGLLFLSGAATAQVWSNETPAHGAVAVQPAFGRDGASVTLRGHF